MFAFELPLALFLDLLVEFVLFLAKRVQFFILVLEDFVEAQQLLVEKGQFVFVVAYQVLVVSQFHDGNLVLLALLLVVLDLAASVVQQFTALANLVLQ